MRPPSSRTRRRRPHRGRDATGRSHVDPLARDDLALDESLDDEHVHLDAGVHVGIGSHLERAVGDHLAAQLALDAGESPET